MEQLSFKFMESQEYNKSKEDKMLIAKSLIKDAEDFVSKHLPCSDVVISNEELMAEANALADKYLNISGMDALCMAARGDFYDTDLEGSILHANLRRIAFLLNMY